MSAARDMTLSERLTRTTVRIECTLPGGRSSVETGFFFEFPHEGNQVVPVIVTNRHVVGGSMRGRIAISHVFQNKAVPYEQFTLDSF
jgi:hypothetical protein